MNNLIIMGAGKVGGRVYNEIILGGNIIYAEVFFYDNDINKQGTYINGILVLSYDEYVKQVTDGKSDIILAADRWKDFLELCKSLNVEEKIIGVYSSLSFWANPYVRRIYGQEGEELYLIEKLFGKYGEGYKGFYVDIGAHHPYRLSNTYWAYMDGWRGINIEPNADTFELFKQVRTRDINVNCGIGYEEKNMNYYKFEESSVNTFDEAEFEGIRIPSEIVSVPVMRLETILDRYKVNKIDFMDIDVEGFEMQVLQSNNWDKYRPEFILVEQKRISVRELIASEIYKYLNDLGYECEWKSLRTAIYKLA